MKVIPRIIAVFLSIAVYLSCVSKYASAGGFIYIADVTPVVQAKSNWCWAACAEMCGKSVNPNSTLTQYDVVQYVKGGQYNLTANWEELLIACRYVTNFSKVFTNGTLSAEELLGYILSRQGVIAILSHSSGTSSYAVVIYQIGTNVIVGENSASSTYSVGFIDPWDGDAYFSTYDGFCNGSYMSYKLQTMVYAV